MNSGTFLAFGVVAALSLATIGQAQAGTSIVLDGTFLHPIGTGSNLTPWSDFTGAGVTRHLASGGIPGNYASEPVGTDLFQHFAALANGTYVLSFDVQNQSAVPAELVFAIQGAGGTPINELFQSGTAEEITLPVSSLFQTESFRFRIDNPSFTPNELYFSNSYDAPDAPIQNSINPTGTVLNIADVTLCEASVSTCTVSPYGAVPEPATWAMIISGFFGLGGLLRSRRALSTIPDDVTQQIVRREM